METTWPQPPGMPMYESSFPQQLCGLHSRSEILSHLISFMFQSMAHNSWLRN